MRGITRALAICSSVAGLALASCQAPDAATDSARETPSALGQRRIEPRLTLGAAYGECRSPCEPGTLCEPVCEPPGHKAPAPVSREAGDASNVTGPHQEAVLTLVEGREEADAEKAIEMLETLVQRQPDDAGLLSDLAAAYFVRAQRARRPADLARAVAYAERAVRQDPRLPEARFNQALALEALSLRTAAGGAWQSYAALDPGSGWAKEARARLKDLQAAIDAETSQSWEAATRALADAVHRGDPAAVRELVDPYRVAARLHVEEVVLPAWATAAAEGREDDASLQLATARMIAVALFELGGDTLLSDAVAAIDGAARIEAPERLQALIQGHLAYGRATSLYREFEIEQAEPLYRSAGGALAGGRSPFAALARLHQAICLFQKQRLAAALQMLEDLRQGADRGHRDLLGRVLWVTALCRIFESQPLQALNVYRESLGHFEAVGERAYAAAIRARLAEVLRRMGETELAWGHRYSALHSTPSIRDERQRLFVFAEAAAGAGELDLPLAALRFQNEAVRVARDSGAAVLIAETLRQHAEMNLEADRPERALEDLENASRFATGGGDAVVQQAVQARIEEVAGLIRLEGAPLRAAERFTEALALLPDVEHHAFRARLHLERARAYRAAGLADRAEPDLAISLEELDREWQRVLDQRRRGEDDALWPHFFAHRRETFELMLRLLAEEGRDAEALDVAERFRARELLDLVADLPPSRSVRRLLDESARPLSAREIEGLLPPGVALVEYAALDERLLIWIVRDRSSKLYVQKVDRGEIIARVEQIRRCGAAFARRGQACALDLEETLNWLHARVAAPVLAEVAAEEKLVFVSDEATHGVPFSALRSGRSGRYLIEDHPISVAPSATLYVYALQRDRALPWAADPGVLAVGDPAFAAASFPGLERLRVAGPEAQRVAALYPRGKLLLAEEATRAAFLRHLDRYPIVHFAGHAIPNPGAPFLSALVLADPSPADGSGELYARELLDLDRLRHTRLVVLSACSTASGQAIGALEVSGLVRPILGAGVPAVVGSLWDVNDTATARLVTTFHSRYRDGADASSALRGAQRELLGESETALQSVLAWAPFQVIGVASPPQSL